MIDIQLGSKYALYIYMYIMKCDWLKNEWNPFITCTCQEAFSVDPATSLDCYKCELTSVLAAFCSCSSSYCLMSYFQNMFNKVKKQI